MDIIPLEGECSKLLFSSVRPWDLDMMMKDGQAKPDSQKADLSIIPCHPLAFGRGHLFQWRVVRHELFYTLSPNTFLHLGAISSLAQEMGGLRYWGFVLPVLAFRL